MNVIKLTNAPNTRDLGGMPTADGRHIAHNRLIRSGALNKITNEDYQLLLDKYNLVTVVDMRTDTEIQSSPDKIDQRVSFFHNPILDRRTLGVTFDKATDMFSMLVAGAELLRENNATSSQYMVANYTKFVQNEFCLNAFHNFLKILLDTPKGAVLWHCTAGKDRAGTSALILEMLLGVDRQVAVKDYLDSNICYQQFNEYMLKRLQEQGADSFAIEQAEGFLIVKQQYIDIVLSEIDAAGGIEAFAKSKLQLTDDDIQQLRQLYLD